MSASNPDTIELAARARTEGLESVLVGGNAVNLYAYLRTTFDVDLLNREKDCKRWTAFFEKHGYTIVHATANFTRMRFAIDPTGALPLDLMLADQRTFDLISQESCRREIAEGVEVPIPKPLHLIAMKLHALRSPARVERGVDFDDIKHLVRSERIDTASSEFRDILNRYASEEIRTRLLRELDSSTRERDAG